MTFVPVQRRKLLLIGEISTAFVLLAVVGVAIGGGAGVLILPGLVGLVLAPLTLNIGFGRTVVSPEGIRTHRLFSCHSCSWPDVTAIDMVKTKGGRGTWNCWIVVTRTSGKPFRLAAPFDSGNGRDPKFGIKHSQIHHYWTQQRVRLLDAQ